MPPGQVDHKIILHIKMRVGFVQFAAGRVDRVKREHRRRIELGRLIQQVKQQPGDRHFRPRLIPFAVMNPQPRLHEPKRQTLVNPRRHPAMSFQQRTDMNVAVDQHGGRLIQKR